jgi:hypothetical protein
VTFGCHLDLKVLLCNIEPLGKIQLMNVFLAFAAKVRVAHRKIANQLEHIDYRTFPGTIWAAYDPK